MVDSTFGKQQFVGKVIGSITDNYTMLKVLNQVINNRKLDQVVMEEFSKFKTKLPKNIEPVSN